MEPSSREQVATPSPLAWRSWQRSLLLFVLCFVVFSSNLRYTASNDSLAASLLPFNLWQGKGFVLDDYGPLLPRMVGYSMIRSRDGHWVSAYPVVPALLATPFYFPFVFWQDFNPFAPGHGNLLRILMEKLVGAILAALSVVVLERVLRYLTHPRAAFWLSLVYAFATPTWSTSSQGLWMHGPSQLLLAGSLWLLVRGEPTGWRGVALGLLAGLLTANRPLNLFFSLAIAWIVWRRIGWRSWPFAAAAAGVALLLVSYNLVFFSSLAGGYADFEVINPVHLQPRWPTLETVGGLLVSNRGLLVFCPFLLALLAWRRPPGRRLEEAAVLAAAWGLNLVGYAAFIFWHGGYCYGPRYLTDSLPVLFFFLAPALERCRGWLARLVFGLAVVYSVLLQAIGAFCFPGGDAGNANVLGLWNLSRSAPVLSLASGPRSPDFLPGRTPGPQMDAALDATGTRVELRWIEPPPLSWEPDRPRWIEVEVTNHSSATWSSIGGAFAVHAVRLLVSWQSLEESSLIQELDHWLALELAPGESVRRRLWVVPPQRWGEYLLTIEPMQREFPRQVPFSALGTRPLVARVGIGTSVPRQITPLGPPIFADDFETGDLSAWSAAQP